MNMDFHVHGILSKKLNFDEELFIQGINFHFLKIILFMKTTDMMLMDFMYI